MRLNFEKGAAGILLASVLSYLGTAFTNVVGIGVFTESFIVDLKLSRTTVSSIYFLSTCIVGLLANLSGMMYTKVGFRRSLVYGNILLMFGFFYLSLLPSLTSSHFTAQMLLVLGFVFLQWVGQGWLVATCRSSVVKKFEGRYQNLMVAIQESAGTIVCAAVPMVLLWLIKNIGWRHACYALCATYVILATIAHFCIRPFSTENEFQNLLKKKATKNKGWWRLLKNPEIWVCNFAITLPILTNSGFYFHLESIAQELNMPSISVAQKVFLMAFVIVSLSLISSMSISRIKVKTLMLYLVLDQMLYVLSFSQLNNRFGAISYIVLGGIGWALFGFLMNTAWSRLYGLEHLNVAISLSLSFSLLLNAFGPVLFAFGKAITGSYKSAFYALNLFALILLVIVLYLSFIEKRPEEVKKS